MKSIKALVVFSVLTLSFSCLSYADAPTKCPDPALIKKAGLMGIQEDKPDNLYVAYQVNKYGTSYTWGFLIGIPLEQVTTKGDGMNKAKAALSTLHGTPEPQAVDANNKQWYCLYENDLKYISATVTPISVSNEMVHSVFSNSFPFPAK